MQASTSSGKQQRTRKTAGKTVYRFAALKRLLIQVQTPGASKAFLHCQNPFSLAVQIAPAAPGIRHAPGKLSSLFRFPGIR